MTAADPDHTARRYAERLLRELGHVGAVVPDEADPPALAWRCAGLLAITGRPDGPGLVCPVALASAADGALLALRTLAGDAPLPPNGASLLGERARLLGLGRQGAISANGSCRLLPARDGTIAINLARADDWDLMSLLLGSDGVADWDDIARRVARLPVADLEERAIDLSLPVAVSRPADPPDRLFPAMSRAADPPRKPPLVVDLTSLWAGPLAASLLAMLGGTVVKVESRTRLDGARSGDAAFYRLLNAAKQSVALDFADRHDRCALGDLVARADIVLEGSRPRALAALGIDREREVARGAVWVTITAHDDPRRVGFGDDAAVAGGVSAAMATGWGTPLFAGDAVADPLTGLHAALGAWAAWRSGGGHLLVFSLAGTVAYASHAGIAGDHELSRWQARAEADEAPHYPPRPVPPSAAAPGADNMRILGARVPAC